MAGFIGRKHSEETKRKISRAKKGQTSWMKGRHHSLATRKKISSKRKINPTKYWLGKHLPAKMKKKKSLSIKRAYREGRMSHMREVWEESGKRWSGENNPRWSGGIYAFKQNYHWVHDDKGRWRKEHRVVAERIIGRDLLRSETIHHINFNKLDNRPKNLYYFPNDNQHKRFHGLRNKTKLKSNLHLIHLASNCF